MTIQRLAITGSSGYLGGKLVEHFRALGVRVLGIDLNAPKTVGPDEFLQLDITDTALQSRLEAFAPDTIIHGAFAFQPMRDEVRMHEINIGGTRNVLAAVTRVRPQRFMVISSATAFGAWPDNPIPMDETWPRRARSEFRYAADKTEAEELIAQFAAEHPKIAVSWPRPAMIGGPGLDNYLSRFIFGMPFLVLLDGHDTAVQFVHERDVTAAIAHILQRDARGAFNVGPPDWTCVSEIARESGRRVIRLPYWFARWLHGLAWAVRFPIHESPASFLYFVRYPWVVAPTRLQNELNYHFQYSSLETLREIIRSRS
jgi:UDP-glucose 4-epimerase